MKAMCMILPWVCFCALSLPAADCNRNGVEDAEDIANAQSEDCNSNALPDECELPPLSFGLRDEPMPVSDIEALAVGDFDGDGVLDLAAGSQARTQESTVTVFLNDGEGTFAPSEYVAGTRLTALAAADLDGDGDVDLVSANSEVLLVFENDGTGVFMDPREIVVPRSTRFVTAADVTGDGRNDLLTTNTSDDTISVLVARDALVFAAAVPYRVGDRPRWVAAGDVDGDGDRDLVTADEQAQAVSVLLNQGAGRFGAPRSYALEARPRFVALADSDKDGFPEIFSETAAGVVRLRNEGDGTYGAVERFTEGTRSAGIGDVDGDGDADLVFALASGRAVEVLLADGSARFGAALTQNVAAELIRLGDFDGDGDLDIAASLPNGGGLHVIWNGVEELSWIVDTIPGVTQPHFVSARDLNGDGFPDLISPNGFGGSVSVFLNNGDATFPQQDKYPLTTDGHLFSTTEDDIDGDGDLDIAVVDRVQARVSILRNRGDGTFDEPVHYATGAEPHFATWADVDGDGFVDLVSADRSAGAVGVYLNDRSGTFGEPQTYAAESPFGIGHGDFDGDGHQDLVVAELTTANLLVLENNGDGTFADGVRYPAPATLQFLVVGDLEADGDLDVVCTGGGLLSIFDNRGDGTFSTPRTLEVPSSISLNAADVNADGILDILVTHWGGFDFSPFLSLFFGIGDGTFLPPHEITLDLGLPKFAAVADLELDGDMDLVIANRHENALKLFYNQATSRGGDVDFLESICTTLGFFEMSIASNRGSVARSGKYIVPARQGVDLLPALFQNVKRFGTQKQFLQEVFPERFEDLTDEGYGGLALRRDTRDYYAGSLSLLRPPSIHEGGNLAYGFDVDVDPGDPAQLLTLAEVEDVFLRLSATFQLEPLVYLPSTEEAKDAAALWPDSQNGGPSFVVLILDDEPPPPPPPPVEPGPTPTFELQIPEDMEICGTFAEASVSRGIRDEYELKSVIRLRGGTIPLPTENETFTETLFEEVRFGPDEAVAVAVSDGLFRVQAVPGVDGAATYRFTYEQEFALPDGRQLVVALVSPLQLRGQGEEPLDGPAVLDTAFFTRLTGRESVQARLDGIPLVNYGACGYPDLPVVRVDAELDDGTTLRLAERYEEAESLFDTAPATVVRAEVTLGGQRRVATDYFKLVYSASRHNTTPVYWVLFDAPVVVEGLGEVHGVELVSERQEPQPAPASAAYLGADLEPLATLGVRRLSRQAAVVLFRRGDSNGDGEVNILDAVALLDFLFRGGEVPPCVAATDANDDGRLNVGDPVRIVGALFGRAAALPAPFPDCGEDPEEDGLTCHEAGVCR